MSDTKYLAYLIVRDFNGNEIHRVGITNLSENRVERVIGGMLINLNPDYYIDESEVDKAREAMEKAAHHA